MSGSMVPIGALSLFLGELPADPAHGYVPRWWPFPQVPDGTFAAEFSGGAAVAQLEDFRRRGAVYLIVPRAQDDWLAERAPLRSHVEGHYREMLVDESCRVFDLRRSPVSTFLESIMPADEGVLAILRRGSDLGAGRLVRRVEGDPATVLLTIERHRSEGFRFLVIPSLRPWGPDLPALADELERRYATVAVRPGICTVFGLGSAAWDRVPKWRRVVARVIRRG